MTELQAIAQIANNVPFLLAEETSDIVTEVNTFVYYCENILACLSEQKDKEIFLSFLPTKIRGRAARVLGGFECKNFDEIKALIYNKLVNTKPYFVQLNELRLCKQLPSETIKSFGERIKLLLKLCQQKAKERHSGDVTLINKDIEEAAIFAFKAGLINPNYRLLVWQDSEKCLDKIISKLEQTEESENQISIFNVPFSHYSPLYNGISNHLLPPTSQISQNTGFLNPTKTLNSNLNLHDNTQNIQASYSNTQNLNQKKEISNNFLQKFVKCGLCSKTNHNYVECRIRKSTPFCTTCKMYGHNTQICPLSQKNSKSINQIQKGRSNNGQLRCDFCQRRGHTIEKCFAKKSWESKQNFNQPQEGNSKRAVTHPRNMN